MNYFSNKLDQKMLRIWETSGVAEHPIVPDKNDVWLRLEQLMNRPETQSVQFLSSTKKTATLFLKPRLAWAFAAVLIFSLVTTLWLQNFAVTNILAERGTQTKSVSLKDGSKITMNAETEISYRAGFGKEHREIRLNGEAYFDVQKSGLPFIVQFGDAVAEVLGTEFNVYSRDGEQDVTVVKGVVKVTAKEENSTAILTPGQQVKIVNGLLLDKSQVSQKFYPDWMYDKLVLDHTKLKDVCNEIERKFDVKINFASKDIEDITLTGIIDAKDLYPVLETLATLSQRSFKFEKNTYIFY